MISPVASFAAAGIPRGVPSVDDDDENDLNALCNNRRVVPASENAESFDGAKNVTKRQGEKRAHP